MEGPVFHYRLGEQLVHRFRQNFTDQPLRVMGYEPVHPVRSDAIECHDPATAVASIHALYRNPALGANGGVEQLVLHIHDKIQHSSRQGNVGRGGYSRGEWLRLLERDGASLVHPKLIRHGIRHEIPRFLPNRPKE